MKNKSAKPEEILSRRERQIMDVLFEMGEASAEEVRERMPDPPSNSAVRAMLSRLENKEMIRHEAKDLRYVYSPAVSRSRARRSAVQRVVDVFFEGSVAKTVTALVELSGDKLTEAERERLSLLIRAGKENEKESDHD